ncbi:glycosyltransferase family 2 protein [Deinococcus sp. PESE-13]
MNIAVIIATKGRPKVLGETLESLSQQVKKPSQIIIVATGVEDLPESECIDGCEVLISSPGLSFQRNLGIAQISRCTDIVLFFDDDVEIHRDYLFNLDKFYLSNPSVIGTTGVVIKDGAIKGPISRLEAQRDIVHSYCQDNERVLELYGCNMSVRSEVFLYENFDTRLAAYGWLEDRDFSSRIKRYGSLIKLGNTFIVHLASRRGRVNDRQLGFAQIMNPLYLHSKGSLGFSESLYLMKPMVKNLINFMQPERRERFIGNILGLITYLKSGPMPEEVNNVG